MLIGAISMNIYLPYFYIIRDKRNGIMYAGSRWSKGCNPSEFMKIDGYTTSSSIINSLIIECGIDIFEILRIDTYCDNLHPYDYETAFLEINNCAKDNNWYNVHNNHHKDARILFGSNEFKHYMIQKYGVDNPSKLDNIKTLVANKRIKTIKSIYGNSFPNLDKFHQTSLENFGTLHPMQSEVIKQKRNKTCLSKTGVDNPFKTSKVKKIVSDKCSVCVTCPHCGKTGKWAGMRRWHFDYCKSFRSDNS